MTTGWPADGDKFPVRTVAVYRIRYFVCCDLFIRFPYKYIKGVVAKLGVWVDRTRGVNRIKDGELHIFGFLGLRQFFIFTVCKRTRMFAFQMKSKVFFIQSKKWVNS